MKKKNKKIIKIKIKNKKTISELILGTRNWKVG